MLLLLLKFSLHFRCMHFNLVRLPLNGRGPFLGHHHLCLYCLRRLHEEVEVLSELHDEILLGRYKGKKFRRHASSYLDRRVEGPMLIGFRISLMFLQYISRQEKRLNHIFTPSLDPWQNSGSAILWCIPSMLAFLVVVLHVD